MKSTLLFALLICFWAYSPLQAQEDPVVAFEFVASSFTRPVDITGAGDGSERLFVVEQPGRIKVIDQVSGMVQSESFLDIVDIVRDNGNEQGLLGLAFHPNFADNGFFFVNFTSNVFGGSNNAGQTVIARYTATGTDLDNVLLDSRKILMMIDQPFTNHNGGDLVFGPDGYLYIGTGDGGSGGDPQDNSQDPEALLGKMLRIDVNVADDATPYAVPTDNPFVGDDNVLDEIWALGLRNPWRYSFDRTTDELWIADVGQVEREEIDLQSATSTGGENYGWDCREGLISYPDSSPGSSSSLCGNGSVYIDPILDYPRSSSLGGFSITGGYVYHGTQADDLQGHYICADYASSNIFIITPDTGSGRGLVIQRNPSSDGTSINDISTFGEDDNGNLYVADLSAGAIYQITGRIIPVSTLDTADPTGGPRIVPNPAYRDFSINIPELQQAGSVNVRVFSGTGRLVYQKVHIEDGGPIQGGYVLPEVPAGVYQVLITYDNQTFVRKLVVK